MKYLSLFLAFLSGIVYADLFFQGEGVISPVSHITIDLNVLEGGKVKGFYQYKKYKTPITLEGKYSENSFSLTAPELTEQFELAVVLNNKKPLKLIGQWKTPNKSSYVEVLLNENPGLCTDVYQCHIQALPLIEKALEGRITVIGDEKVCSNFLRKRLIYPRLNAKLSFSEKALGSGDQTERIELGSYQIDINNDGSKENVVAMNMYSGKGQGCNQEYQQVISGDRRVILGNELNRSLHPQSLRYPESCSYYSRPFIFNDKVYIENRAAKFHASEIGIDSKIFKGLFVSFLSDVYVIEGSKRKTLCHYDYIEKVESALKR